jgi:hypothetical protein
MGFKITQHHPHDQRYGRTLTGQAISGIRRPSPDLPFSASGATPPQGLCQDGEPDNNLGSWFHQRLATEKQSFKLDMATLSPI